ncbi:hypothetical protein HMPREF3128_15705 [Enterococcus sp. HMSC14A10]|nr:hypothetical protein HMPREF3128_15705 [Enterococcus sp. HMSC14A10]
MFPFIFSSLPAFVFLIIFPSLFKHLSKSEHYRFNSLYGFVQLKLSKMHQTGSFQLALSIFLKGFISISLLINK